MDNAVPFDNLFGGWGGGCFPEYRDSFVSIARRNFLFSRDDLHCDARYYILMQTLEDN